MKTTEPPVIVKQSYTVAIAKVWKALTQVEEMRQWFFPDIPEYKAEVGFKTEFVVDTDERRFPHLWKVLEVVPQQRMVQEWKYRGYEGVCTVAFELLEQQNVTHLTVTATVLEDFSDAIPEFTRESCKDGWQYFIQQQLKKYLEA